MQFKPTWIHSILASICLASVATAAETGANLQRFEPEPNVLGGFGTGSGAVLNHLSWAAGLHLNYSRNPLTANEDNVRLPSISSNFTAHLHAAVGIADWVELGVGLPVVLSQTANDATLAIPTGVTLGDLRIQPRIRILKQKDFGVAVAIAPIFTIPLGGYKSLVGEQSVGIIPELTLSHRFDGGSYLGFEARYIHRSENVVILPASVGDSGLIVGKEITARVAGAIAFTSDLEGLLELDGGVALATRTAGSLGNPLEILGGIRYRLDDWMALDFGVGGGLLSAPGTPDLRLIGGVNFGSGLRPGDRIVQCISHTSKGDLSIIELGTDGDKDTIDDACDVCPLDAEVVNGKDDLDGCPDFLDGDNDGFPDDIDQCPTVAGIAPDGCPDLDADKDGIVIPTDVCPTVAGIAPDGCPPVDTDGDGIFDPKDQCINDPEDKDSFQDEDGCPDLDNDNDGILDSKDICVNNPEDKDGFKDEDGCPEPDNDSDGFLDANDKCPNEAEIINGVDDTDGCPDKGKSLVVLKADKIEILDKVFFATGKDVIEKKSFPLLKQVASVLKPHAEIKHIEVQGHTDDVGDAAKNKDLSQRRADAVKKFLIAEGVEAERLTGKGYGKDLPRIPNKDAKSRAENRRVEFVIIP